MSETLVVDIKGADIYQHNHNLVLHGVDLQVEKGDFIYVIGKTGSGKSSLLKTLYAELPLRDGQASVAGYDLKKISNGKVPQLRRKLGIVFQDFQLLYDRTVYSNLDFVLRSTKWKSKAERRIRIEEVLTSVGLTTKMMKMPHELSGGEQQRLVIARALLNHPELLIADEPTGNLDPEVADDIMKLMKDISNQGTAVVMATHDYRLINKFYGKIYRCDAGKISPTSAA